MADIEQWRNQTFFPAGTFVKTVSHILVRMYLFKPYLHLRYNTIEANFDRENEFFRHWSGAQ